MMYLCAGHGGATAQTAQLRNNAVIRIDQLERPAANGNSHRCANSNNPIYSPECAITRQCQQVRPAVHARSKSSSVWRCRTRSI